MVEYICIDCKKPKTFTEVAYYYCGRPRISKTCKTCRENKKEAQYIKNVMKRHKLRLEDKNK